MALGTRSYGSALLTQNLFIASNLPDKLPALKNFAGRILTPSLKCVEAECGTTIGRLLQVPESNPEGLIRLDNNSTVTEQDVIDMITSDSYTIRVRDTSSCLSKGGFCRNCGTGYMARKFGSGTPELGKNLTLQSSARSYQNYIAGTYSGSVMGWLSLSSDPLPTTPDNWSLVTSHAEMDKMCKILSGLNVPSDDMAYIYSVTDLLERALLIIATYGVYGNV